MNVQVNFLKNEALGKVTHNLKSFYKGKCEKILFKFRSSDVNFIESDELNVN